MFLPRRGRRQFRACCSVDVDGLSRWFDRASLSLSAAGAHRCRKSSGLCKVWAKWPGRFSVIEKKRAQAQPSPKPTVKPEMRPEVEVQQAAAAAKAGDERGRCHRGAPDDGVGVRGVGRCGWGRAVGAVGAAGVCAGAGAAEGVVFPTLGWAPWSSRLGATCRQAR